MPILKFKFPCRFLGTLVFEVLILVSCWMVFLGDLERRAATCTALHFPELFILTGTAASQFGLWFCGLYSRPVIYRGRGLPGRLAGAFLLSTSILGAVHYAFGVYTEASLESAVLLHGLLLPASFLAFGVARTLTIKISNGSAGFGNTLFLGRLDESTRRLIIEARKHDGNVLNLAGILADEPNGLVRSFEGVSVLGTVFRIREVVKTHHVQTVIINLPYDHPGLQMEFLLEWKLSGNQAMDARRFYESIGLKVLIERFDSPSILSPDAFHMPRLRRTLKDIYETGLALIFLALFAPLLLLIALSIRLTSPGPIIYRQRRVGKGGGLFTMYKFRTMVENAEGASGPVWCSRRDPRVTCIGALLRRTHLDELPQLFNILKGEMAFVGPRPERPEFVKDLASKIEFYDLRHCVKPGLTGWAQVSFPYAASLEESKEKLRYDLYYLKYMSPIFDWMIILATIRSVLRNPEPIERPAAPRFSLERFLKSSTQFRRLLGFAIHPDKEMR